MPQIEKLVALEEARLFLGLINQKLKTKIPVE